MDYKSIIERCIYNTPLSLKEIKDKDSINYINLLLPRDTGIEFECGSKQVGRRERAYPPEIPNLVSIGGGDGEVRFRIPTGIKGFETLYQVSLYLKEYYGLNLDSGIHYHIDMTGYMDGFTSSFIENNKESVLKELDSWGYQGTYNPRNISTSRVWVRISGYQTLEFRIGEMTFEYELLVKRILHCQKICRDLRGMLDDPSYKYRLKIEELKKQEEVTSLSEANRVTSSRVIRL